MKRFCALLITTLVSFHCFAQVDLAKADALFDKSSDPSECVSYLESALPKAANGNEKCQVLCRLSKSYLILGQNETSKEKKQKIFGKGIEYAEQAIKEDPKNPEGYMWHSGNVGRECQTHAFTEQVKKLPVIMNDITTILDKMKMTDYSPAWQAMGEIYMNHPMKSDDDAINFTRKAIQSIPKGSLQLSAYTLLARLLYERDWNAAKRSSAINKDAEKFKQKYESVIDRYAFYDGSLGTGFKPAWSSGKTLSEMSDREEAKAVAAYAKSLYDSTSDKTSMDKTDYQELLKLSSKW